MALTASKKTQLLTIALDFLKGDSSLVTQIHLGGLTAEVEGKELYQQIKLDDLSEGDKAIVRAILLSVGIKESDAVDSPYRKAMACVNLHDLLRKLYNDKDLYLKEDGNFDAARYRASRLHIGYLIVIIRDSRPRISWLTLFFLGALSSIGLGMLAYFTKTNFDSISNWVQSTLPNVAKWLGRTFSLLRNFAIIGAINQLIILSWHYYQALRSDAVTVDGVGSRLGYATLIAASNISANILCFYSGGLLIMPAACLFFLASVIEIVENVAGRWHSLQIVEPNADAPWEEMAQYHRARHLQTLNNKVLGVTVLASVLVITSVAIWCFFQPPFLITVACMAFAWCISWAKETIISRMNEQVMDNIQVSINGIENEQSDNLLPRPVTSHTRMMRQMARSALLASTLENARRELLTVHDENRVLIERNEQLNNDNQRIQAENTALIDQLGKINREGKLIEIVDKLTSHNQSLFDHIEQPYRSLFFDRRETEYLISSDENDVQADELAQTRERRLSNASSH